MPVWEWIGYPSTPAMTAGAFPVIAKLAISKADGLHAWEGLWRMGVDAGRTEGVAIASAFWVGLILVSLLGGAAVRVMGSLIKLVLKR